MTITTPATDGTFWDGLRVVVLDTETTETPDGTPRRCVSVGAVTCRYGSIRSRWQRLVDPGVPIDPVSQSIHHITAEHVAGERGFADVADDLLARLEARDGETVIVAGHNIGFDVSVLRYELQACDRDLPDVATIDTMGPLVELAGLDHLNRPSLAVLLAELGHTNRAAHDALADAEACAEALLTLLQRAAERGHRDRDELLACVASLTTHAIKPGSRARLPRPSEPDPDLPADHLEAHSTVLSSRAGVRMLADWQRAVAQCATLRCGHLDGRVEQAGPAPAKLLPQLTAVLDERLAAADTAGTATVLGPLAPLLAHLPPRKGRLGLREAVLAWTKKRASGLAALGRCDDDRCPACRHAEPCPLDVWPDAAAEVALGDPERYARGFFEMTGKEAGTGVYTTWLDRGIDQRVCDAALWLSVEHWRRVEMFKRAEQVIELGWHAGSRHPDIADAYAGQLAAGGRLANLDRALEVCDEVLESADGSTHPGFGRLWSRRNQLAGRRQRLLVRPSGEFDEDGNPIPARRHHPTRPRRVRPSRFLSVLERDGSAGA